MSKLSILIVNDDQNVIKSISKILIQNEIQIDIATCSEELEQKINRNTNPYHAIICDLDMDRINGLEFAKQFYEQFPMILMTNYLDEKFEDVIHNMCDAYVERSEAHERLYPALLKAIERKHDRSLKVA